jgi:shikimate dehydrogenase
MRLYGLIGYPLGHSFSEKFFSEKFVREGIDAKYQLFPIKDVELFPLLLANNLMLCGMNVTIPYKEKIIPFLNELDETAREIGAVNVIKFIRNGMGLTLRGYNSDVIGFENSFKPLLQAHHNRALILGTGGASKGVAYVLRKLGIAYKFVSRTPDIEQYSYTDLTPAIIEEYPVIINTTPIGTYPKDNECPYIPYEALTEKHLLYDLVYNPTKTLFLQKGEKQKAVIKNGLEMLHGQALAAWDIWQDESVKR